MIVESEDEDEFLNSCIAENKKMVAENDKKLDSEADKVINVYQSRLELL